MAQEPATLHTGLVIDLHVSAVELAPRLLGCLLCQDQVTVRITEVEAYAGLADPASHAYGGPRPRTKDLFAPPGTFYCYLSYGLHVCGNLVCGAMPDGSAVLLRAGQVVAGLAAARARRGPVPEAHLGRGPGNLGRAMGWTLAHSGGRLSVGGLELAEPAQPVVPSAIESGPRVGVSVAHQRPWRFWLTGEPSVSAYRRSPRAEAGDQAW